MEPQTPVDAPTDLHAARRAEVRADALSLIDEMTANGATAQETANRLNRLGFTEAGRPVWSATCIDAVAAPPPRAVLSAW